MVIVTLRITVPLQTRADVIGLFDSYRGPVSAMAGCRSVHLYTHSLTPAEFILVEEWGSQGALESHVRSEEFRKVLAIMDLAGEPPELKFHNVSSAKGFELVQKLREQGVDS